MGWGIMTVALPSISSRPSAAPKQRVLSVATGLLACSLSTSARARTSSPTNSGAYFGGYGVGVRSKDKAQVLSHLNAQAHLLRTLNTISCDM